MSRKIIALPVLLITLAFAAGTCTAEEATPNELQTLVDANIRPLMQEYDIAGMAVAITHNGQAHYFNYGVARLDDQQPVTSDTLFEIGSLSKTLTATLAALAQATGKLALSESAGQHLPELRGSSLEHTSLLDLGTYTAGGLPLQFPDSVTDQDSMFAYYQQWQPEHNAGAYRRYSNPSIGLLGLLAARSMGQQFPALMEGTLFPALGMRQSYIQVPATQMSRYAYGYAQDNQAVRVTPGMLDAEAYGVKTNARDMLRFVQANLNPTRLSLDLQHAIATTQTGYYRIGEMTQGLGWERYPYPISLERLQTGNSPAMALEAQKATLLTPPKFEPDTSLFNKTGSTNGFGAYAVFVPGHDLGLVLLANRNYPNAARVKAAHAILTALANHSNPAEPHPQNTP
ncbi:class C beta-lactamase [Phytopseudomonas daroniae]|uniref:class C beta-lactamase n=1 Tax=Phytopseudomonas daroniae TaxID=2487519 RepID=UPI0010383E68|nr:class C beta-lactamase [Pseudomonas daroniae]TBU77003.1 class C beta-lactamase [Pseudomonas daroniae]